MLNHYKGCKGNGNRFGNVEDCVNTCGGSSNPVTNSDDKCKHVQCDLAEANVRSYSFGEIVFKTLFLAEDKSGLHSRYRA